MDQTTVIRQFITAQLSFGDIHLISPSPMMVAYGTMKAVDYINVITDQVHPFIASVFQKVDEISKQNNTLCHKTKIVSNWFIGHNSVFNVLPGEFITWILLQ
ncbi:hypothetical protein NPIL_580701 [Nephila pilipes]|uniref:Uncharacterized protein n=1 Tax=Nephila pilipes TaxID=299642 RepID=A0A8X6U9Z0_NEPPI|nr:hypothetical protein NPIL_580701 [Nephila pilipes]